MKFVFGNNIVEYFVTENELENFPVYGIKALSNGIVYEKMDNLFFTKEEAINRCKWLARNEVLPEIFRDVMADIMLW